MRSSFFLPAALLLASAWMLNTTGPPGLPAPPSTLWADESTPRVVDKPAAAAAPPVAKRGDDDEYFDLLRLFADTLDQIDRNYVKEVSRRELMEAAIEGLLSKLDAYSDYIPPDELETFKSGVESEFGGIGIQIGMEDGQLTVISPIFGSPAYRAGVLAGDRIVQIGDKSTEGLSLDEAVRRLKGKVGTSVTMSVMHAHNAQEQTVTLEREMIQIDTVLGERRRDDDTWDFMYDPQEKIGYIRLVAFGRDTADKLTEALEELQNQGLRGLVLDLRFNPGGLLTAAVEVSDLFLAKGVIVSTAGRNTQQRLWEAQEAGSYLDFPLVVLVNNYSASASEIVAACLQDHQRAVIVGERTWGKGSVQNVIELEEGRSALKLTTAGYQRPNGHNIHRFEGAADKDEWGVRPDKGFEVKLSPQETARLLIVRRQRDILQPKGAAENGEAAAAEKPAEATAPDKEPAATDRAKPAADQDPSGNGDSNGNGKFVDRQLQKALEHLRRELAKSPKDAAR